MKRLLSERARNLLKAASQPPHVYPPNARVLPVEQVQQLIQSLADLGALFDPAYGAPLDELRHVARDAWLEAGGCDLCWGTGVIVYGEYRAGWPYFGNVTNCSCWLDEREHELGICPDLPAHHVEAIVRALKR